MAKPVNDFQSIVFALQKYWADWGCTLWQPYYSQVGAGTMNPATFLRVLGPEPWNVAYVEPSVRPDDGRYGENPNRLQQHHQFQVILKPDPGNPQESYLRSLEAIGIPIEKHDIRFVEDNWNSPALGAWGLGWEVWLDGLEITQFTYFQQAGGLTLEPVSVEITYGLDRIAMALQGKAYVGDVQWSPERSWGDLNIQGEQEHSKYYFELADVDRLKQMFELYETEALAALDAGLVLPAYDYVLKCSHTFNILDTRGAVGVTERQGLFRRMRKLAGQVAEAYAEKRQMLEYPWLDDKAADKAGALGTATAVKFAKLDKPGDFLFELGTEELPPGDLENLLTQMREKLPVLLDELRLEHGEIAVHGTPRRLVATVEKLAAQQASRDEIVKGPPAERAFDADGKPTKAAEGFARGKGLTAADLKVEEIDGGQYVVAHVHEDGGASIESLAGALPDFVASLQVDKNMRWNASGKSFSRPIRWLLAMQGGELIPFEYAGLPSAKQTRGLRLTDMEEVAVSDTQSYFKALEKQNIILDEKARKAAILDQIQALAASKKASIPDDPDLLSEVTNLVEAPKAMLGEFEAEFLDLPREALIAVMKKHQRYFPLEKNGKLINAFIAVGNGEFDPEAVIVANADVIRARFADAAYFVQRDRKRKLADFVPELETLTFQEDLGSMLDKSQRLEKLVADLAPMLGLSEAEKKTAVRAAQLAKADLATQMVVEMTSLQGTMGKYYALDAGESAEVAQAIEEHYLPRQAGGKNPNSKAGLALGLADRLDTLAGLFAVGLAPSGAKDPFALRRTAIGLVQSLIAANQDFDIAAALEKAKARLPVEMTDERLAECLNFIVERMRNSLYEMELPSSSARRPVAGVARAGQSLTWQNRFRTHPHYDIVNCVLSVQGNNPAGAMRAVKELAKHVEHNAWPDVLDTYARCARITRDVKSVGKVDEKLFEQDEEKQLFAALAMAETEKAKSGEGDVLAFLQAFMPMMPAIKAFFEEVLVNAEDEKLRANRLALLQRVTGLAEGVADLSLMEGF